MSLNSSGKEGVPLLDLNSSDIEHCDKLSTKNYGGSGDHKRLSQSRSSYGTCTPTTDSSNYFKSSHEARRRYDIEEDSGLPDSLRAPSGGSLKTSVSNATSSIDDDDEVDSLARVMQDFTQPQRKTNLVRITPSFNPSYDEEVKVCSSTGGSSGESPRSETSDTEYSVTKFEDSEGTEMTTISRHDQPYPTYSDDDRCLSEHKHLYGGQPKYNLGALLDKSCANAKQSSSSKYMNNDIDEDDQYTSQSQRYRHGFQSQPVTQFDRRVSMNLSYNMCGSDKDTPDFSSDGSRKREKKKNRGFGEFCFLLFFNFIA